MRFRRLLALGPSGWWELGEAQLWLIWAWARMKVVPRGRLVTERPSDQPSPRGGHPADHDRIDDAEQIATAIRRTAKYGIVRAQCLLKSIALQRMLRAHRIPESVVCFGVRTHHGEFQSHAWVEINGRIIGDDPQHVASFARLDRHTA